MVFSCLSVMGDEIKETCVCMCVYECRPKTKWFEEISHGVNHSHQLPLTSISKHCNLIFRFMFFFSLNWIYSFSWCVYASGGRRKKWELEKLQRNMFVVHAISDYYILFLFSCTWLFFSLLLELFFSLPCCLIATE